jgi:REP element-mobilizing transposase RayT
VSEFPSAYFVTFTTYGTSVHGDERGSVDRKHNALEEPMLLHNRARQDAEERAMGEAPYLLTEARRTIVANSFRETCTARGWSLLAMHIRTNHVHLAVQGKAAPERIMRDLKPYASRRLSERLGEPSVIRRWTRHGSTKYLWKPESVEAAVKYVVEEQGRLMEVHEDTDGVDL